MLLVPESSGRLSTGARVSAVSVVRHDHCQCALMRAMRRGPWVGNVTWWQIARVSPSSAFARCPSASASAGAAEQR